MRIFLVRHGQTDWNIEKRAQYDKPIPLNTAGKAQARQLARHFKKIPLTHAYASPTTRTQQTAEFIAKPHKLKVILVQGFHERNPGKLIGLSPGEIRQKIPDIDEQHARHGIDWRPDCGETLRELQQRVNTTFKKLLKKHKKDDAILIVSHGATLKSVVHYVHGGKSEDFLHAKSIENAEIVEIEYERGKSRIIG